MCQCQYMKLVGCVCDLVSAPITDPVVYACAGDCVPYVERAGKCVCMCVCVCVSTLRVCVLI